MLKLSMSVRNEVAIVANEAISLPRKCGKMFTSTKKCWWIGYCE